MSTLNDNPTLLFTPYAWRKLLFFRDRSSNEVGALGISEKSNSLIIRDLYIPKQEVTSVSCDFNMDDVADIYAKLDGRGLSINDYARIWIHTHPGDSPNPSGTDEATFRTNYGKVDWAIMFILAKGGKTYARLRLNKPISIAMSSNVAVSWSCPFEASAETEWAKIYKEKVHAYEVIQHAKNSQISTYLGPKHPKLIQGSNIPKYPNEALEIMGDSCWWEDYDDKDILDPYMDELEELAYEQYLESLRHEPMK